MIDFRYHLVSIIAIFMALAVGIVLGAGPLKEDIGAALTSDLTRLRQDKVELNSQLTAARRQAASGDSFASTTRPVVLRGRLTGKHVVIVVAAGADERVVSGIEDAVQQAGGAVSTIARLGQEWTRPDEAGDLPKVTAQVAPGLGIDATDLPGGRLAGAVLGRSLLTSSAKDGYHADSVAVGQAVAALKDKGLLSVTTQDPAVPTLAVAVLAPMARTGTQSTDPQVKTYAGLAEGLDGAGDGVVAVAPTRPTDDTAGTTAGSVLTGLRGTPSLTSTVSTVDDADTAMGQVATALALAEQQGGHAGRYGTSQDADAVVPDLNQ